MRRLPDTGQAQSFTNTFGEDADYSQNPPFFKINGDGTVTDTVTGLMWQQADGGEMTIENAVAFCENLVLGGHDDWRLPTAQEAYSILNQGKTNPALDVAIFTYSGAEYWWTSERDATNANKIWVTNKGGGVGNHLKTEAVSAGGTKKIHVRAVRDMQTPPQVSVRFSETFATVYDSLTGLEWQRFVVPTIQDSMTWENALTFAENFVLAGKNDWRMPNIKELQSLNDETRSQPSISTDAFPGIGIRKYWSSTSLPNQPTRAWYLDTRFGITTYDLKTARNNLLCVRGGNQVTTAAFETSAASAASLRVFPNPFSANIWVEQSPEAHFDLVDGFGRPIFSGANLSEQDFSGLSRGVYFLKVSGKNTAATRIIKL